MSADLHLLKLGSSRTNWVAGAYWVLVPGNITLLPLPPACPELDEAENIRQYLRQNYLGNRVFANYTAILDARQDAWRKLLAEAGRITSMARREWAMIGQPF